MGETRCPVDGAPVPQHGGPGRPRTYCSTRCRRRAERLARRERNWAQRDPALGAVDLDVPALDVDALNRYMSRMR